MRGGILFLDSGVATFFRSFRARTTLLYPRERMHRWGGNTARPVDHEVESWRVEIAEDGRDGRLPLRSTSEWVVRILRWSALGVACCAFLFQSGILDAEVGARGRHDGISLYVTVWDPDDTSRRAGDFVRHPLGSSGTPLFLLCLVLLALGQLEAHFLLLSKTVAPVGARLGAWMTMRNAVVAGAVMVLGAGFVRKFLVKPGRFVRGGAGSQLQDWERLGFDASTRNASDMLRVGKCQGPSSVSVFGLTNLVRPGSFSLQR